MEKKVVMMGNEALMEAAIQAGCKFFAGYPITPQTEIVEYASWRLPEVGGVYLQAESEVSAISMIIGASVAGERCMTASSNPGIALMTEGFGAAASGRFPMVIVDVIRSGAANVGITASQSDYNLLTKTFGPGGLRALVYGPSTVQEIVDIMGIAFDAADRYRNPVVILTDTIGAQTVEPVTFEHMIRDKHYDKSAYTPSGRKGDNALVIHDSPMRPTKDPDSVANSAQEFYREYARMYASWEDTEVRCEEYLVEDAEYVIVAWGSSARICLDTVHNLRAEGVKVGMIRPITLFPFPKKPIMALKSEQVKGVLSVEMCIPAQLYHDVKEYLPQDIRLESYTTGAGVITDAAKVEQAFRDLFLK